jgi:prepilin-type processing-associated H-X9-DG protein
LLAALLLPALKSAREKARQVGCKSNLKQIYLAAIMYTQDNNDSFLPCLIWTAPGIGITWGSYISPKYIPDLQRTRCPSDTNGYIPTSPIYGCNYFSYGNNPYLGNLYDISGPTTLVLQKITWINDPVARMYFADHFSYALWSWVVPPASPYPMDYRHSGGFNLSFLDGHVEWRGAPFPDYYTSPPW